MSAVHTERAKRLYDDVAGHVGALYDLAVEAGADKTKAANIAHRICGCALALRADVTNAHNAASSTEGAAP